MGESAEPGVRILQSVSLSLSLSALEELATPPHPPKNKKTQHQEVVVQLRQRCPRLYSQTEGGRTVGG